MEALDEVQQIVFPFEGFRVPELHARTHQVDGLQLVERAFDHDVHQDAVGSVRGEGRRGRHAAGSVDKYNLAVTRPGCLSIVKGTTFIAPQFADHADIGLAYEQLQLSPVVATSSARGKSSAA